MEKWEMKMHLGKTKVMIVSRTGDGCSVTIDDEKIEEVQSLKYLGSSISADESSDEDIEQQIGAVTRVIGAMRKEVLERRELKKEMKLRVLSSLSFLSSSRPTKRSCHSTQCNCPQRAEVTRQSRDSLMKRHNLLKWLPRIDSVNSLLMQTGALLGTGNAFIH